MDTCMKSLLLIGFLLLNFFMENSAMRRCCQGGDGERTKEMRADALTMRIPTA